MTLDELRKQLAALESLPGDTLVVLAAGPEGVHYSPIQLVTEGLYDGDANVGEFYLSEELRQRADNPSEFSEAPPAAKPAVAIFPRG